MGKITGISWTDHTFNGIWGCQRVSPACESCYAETFSHRLGFAIWGPPKTTERRAFGAKHWAEPLRWNAAAERAGVRRKVFAYSMGDWCEDHPTVIAQLPRLWELWRATPWLDWLMLTKRHDRIAESLPQDWGSGWPSVWLGVTAENQEWADRRIPALLKIPAVVRWLSIEPLLGPVTLGVDMLSTAPRGLVACDSCGGWGYGETGSVSADGHPYEVECRACSGSGLGVQWAIVGGESGAHARVMRELWVSDLLRECRTAEVAFHFKQTGDVLARALGLKDRSGKDAAEWPEWVRVQEFPAAVAAERGVA